MDHKHNLGVALSAADTREGVTGRSLSPASRALLPSSGIASHTCAPHDCYFGKYPARNVAGNCHSKVHVYVPFRL